MNRGVLDIYRRGWQRTFSLKKGEEVVVIMSGSYDTGTTLISSWRLCNIALTNRRVIFYQLTKILISIPLEKISEIQMVKRPWILQKQKTQLYLGLKNYGRRFIFVCVRDPERWKATIEYLKKAGELLGVKNSWN